MTLDEMIRLLREIDEEEREEAYTAIFPPYADECTERAENCKKFADWLEELKEYRDLEEQGLLLKLPCKIGDTVYQLINSHIYEYKVIDICFDIFQNKWMYEVAYQIGLEWFKTMCDFDAFRKSKTVFLTKEEAEEKLKELNISERN